MLIFLIARLSSSWSCGPRTQLGLLRLNASLTSHSFSSLVKSSESNQSEQNRVESESFTVSYLVNSCGVSARDAEELSKRVKLKDPDNPDSVLKLLRSYGFSCTHISKVLKFNPRLLLVKPENNLLPKLRFLESIGFSASEIPELVSSNSKLLTLSLEKRIIPHYEALKSVLGDPVKARRCLKSSGRSIFSYGYGVTNIFPNIKVLRDEGMPQSSVCTLLFENANLAFMNQSKFVEYVKFVKETGIEPSKVTFVHALIAVTHLSKSTWERKLDFFERCGWSTDVTLSAFSKFPTIMLLSEKKITNTMNFFVDEMGLRLEDTAGCPTIFSYSLKRRIIPRWSVFQILKMKGLVKANMSIPSMIIMSEAKFLENFVIKFQENVPQLLELYRGELGAIPEVQT
ncbi:hypothetical protein QN277_018662 [Acacia crassicarpa]|uniref:Uncharacterized protein n=1 Tax=Acacia crassicarpa TaxID=499986 RepID=A0AAE1JU06_9FABA|nr:hypothetical protein QN277_018662 [Acacia crassicarpa]